MTKQRNESKDRNQNVLIWLFAIVFLLSSPIFAADSLARWAETFDQPLTQKSILDRIHPGQIGPVSAAVIDPKARMYYFPKGGTWVRLGKDKVVSTGATPYFVVSCLYSRDPQQDSITATSYLLRDTAQRATALSAGYAAHERVQRAVLPKLGRSFLVLTGSSPGGPSDRPWSASLLEIAASGMSDRPKSVWTSPRSAWSFQFGFDDLGGPTEELVMRILPRNNTAMQYTAYRWEGGRFEADGFASENRMKSLPESVWQFNASQ